jgi:hypothetical protein
VRAACTRRGGVEVDTQGDAFFVALVYGNVDNPTDDISWGAPGTLLAALAMGDWTGEPRGR